MRKPKRKQKSPKKKIRRRSSSRAATAACAPPKPWRRNWLGDKEILSRVELSPEDEHIRWRLDPFSRGKVRTDIVIRYARRRRGTPVYRYVMRQVLGHKIPRGMVVDHIDRNPLNNRRDNLRLCTPQQNAANRSVSGRGSSKYKGVTKVPSGRWKAALSVTVWSRKGHRKYKKATINLGLFDTEEEAARAYDATAVEWFGEYACINFPEE